MHGATYHLYCSVDIALCSAGTSGAGHVTIAGAGSENTMLSAGWIFGWRAYFVMTVSSKPCVQNSGLPAANLEMALKNPTPFLESFRYDIFGTIALIAFIVKSA